MSTRTPKMDLTVPDVNDYIAAWPQIAEQGFLDLENSLIIDYHVAADGHDTYPVGMSMFTVTTSSATSGGWPEGSGMVISFRRIQQDITFQLKVSQGVDRSPNVWARTGSSSGWSPWGVVTSRDTGITVAGEVRVENLEYDVSLETHVVYPTGFFSETPNVSLTIQSAYPAGYMVSVSSKSANAFNFRVNRVRESAASAVVILWSATQTAAVTP